ncbi:MAG: ribonuclease P protein component [Acidobacteria bacterium]|nr:ribonuclease P protein component [Acidobacteriota bacterium]
MTDLAPKCAKKIFPKRRRLLRHADFDRVYKQGRRYFAEHMTIFYLLRESESELKGPRIGFTVGKAMGGAVVRNRIKRRLREAVRLNGFPERLAVDVVINPKRSVLTVEFRDLESEVAKAFEAVGKSGEKGKLR